MRVDHPVRVSLRRVYNVLSASPVRPVVEASLVVWPTVIVMAGAGAIYWNGDKLGVLMWPVFLLYFTAVAAAAAMVWELNSRRLLRSQIGDELYYQLYPRDWRRRERKKARQERRLQRVQRKRVQERDTVSYAKLNGKRISGSK